MVYPILKKDPEFLEFTTEDDEINELKYRIEKHDHGNSVKTL